MKFYNIFFSPTGGTKKVADIIINGTKQEAEVIDLIKEPDKIKKAQFKKDDVCLVACTVLWRTHSVSYNRNVSKCKGRRYEGDSLQWYLETVQLTILYWSYRMFWKRQVLYASQEWRLSQNIPYYTNLEAGRPGFAG